MPNLQVFTRLSMSSTEVEARLSFGHKVDPGTSLWGVRDDTRSDGSSPELTLLRTTPPVGMGQYEFNFVSDRVPAELPVLVGGNEEGFRRIEEVAQEIGKDVDNCFSNREVRGHLVPQRRRRPCG
jgi:hypothetical protein